VRPINAFSLRYFVKQVSAVGLFVLAVASGQLYGQGARGAAPTGLPAGDGKDLVAVACSQCHGLKTIMTLRYGPAGWKIFVDDMVLRGAQLGPQEADTVIQYLSQNFGPSAGPMQAGKNEAQPLPLPSGPGQDLIQSHCTLCHDLSRVTQTKRSTEGWSSTVKGMMANINGLATSEEIQTMTSYLAAHFGKDPK
jgi:cytochrome c5